jgi:hypothetical protein
MVGLTTSKSKLMQPEIKKPKSILSRKKNKNTKPDVIAKIIASIILAEKQ